MTAQEMVQQINELNTKHDALGTRLDALSEQATALKNEIFSTANARRTVRDALKIAKAQLAELIANTESKAKADAAEAVEAK